MEGIMKKLKTGALATLIACAMAACLGLVACSSGPTDEEVIKEGIASELDPIKNLDDATLDEILSEAAANSPCSSRWASTARRS